MKKLCTLLAAALFGVSMWSCEYNDEELWQAVDELDSRVQAMEKAVGMANSDIATLQGLVEALQEKISITSVTATAEGYRIVFSDGTTATIANGKDGIDAPAISIRQDTDGIYYWTLDGEWLLVDGEKVRAQGNDGQAGAPGQNAVAPLLRIDAQSGEWELSTDGGQTWTSMGVKAEGEDGDSLFSGVVTDDPDNWIFSMADGTQIRIPKSAAFDLTIGPLAQVEYFACGQSRTFPVKATGVADYTIARCDGWKASYEGEVLTVTAPAANNTYAERSGEIALHAVSEDGRSKIVKMEVEAYEVRVLTFEDADYRGTGNYLGYSDWSSLIDTPQYGGPLLYGDYMNCDYNWYDENNTFLASELPTNWGSKVYWGGGHAVSDYVETDLGNGDFNHQLSVYHRDPSTGFGGHGGSQNFCMHYGYRDNSGYSTDNLPCFYFADGQARVVDHMWVMNSTYAVNCYLDGNSLTPSIGPDDWVKLVAIGYDEEGAECGQCEIFMCNGPEQIVLDWTKWDLSSLGKVLLVEFNVTGSSDNGYGFSQPAYFAYDDVAVRF